MRSQKRIYLGNYFNLEEDLHVDFYDPLPHGALEKERMDAFSHAVTNVFKDKCKISSKLIPNSYCEFSRGGPEAAIFSV